MNIREIARCAKASTAMNSQKPLSKVRLVESGV
jgi:hypothetical protein